MGFGGFPPQDAAVASAVRTNVIFERSRMKYVTVLLIGLMSVQLGVSQQNVNALRTGQVHAEGRAVADAAGPFNALGATLFWGAWGYKFDRARLERNLRTLSAAGVNYVRILGSVGGATWEDRETDPRWSDYDAIIAGMTDLAYDRYGMRVQWTLFGGSPFTPAGASREKLVDRFAALARGREHKIFAFEIANEAWQNGFPGAAGVSELRNLGKRLNDSTSVLVALSSPQGEAACSTYADAGVDAMTLHYDRAYGSEGALNPLLRPWNFQANSHLCRGKLPSIVLNNEPIGPESSVRQDDSPSRIAAAYVMTFLAGNAGYVLHAGPGIRGGGVADVSSRLRRHANFDELPTFNAIAAALAAPRRYLPAGLANWTRHAPNAATSPVRGSPNVYSASLGSEFVALAVGISHPTTVHLPAKAAIDVWELKTGKVVEMRRDTARGTVELGGHDALVIVGRRP